MYPYIWPLGLAPLKQAPARAMSVSCIAHPEAPDLRTRQHGRKADTSIVLSRLALAIFLIGVALLGGCDQPRPEIGTIAPEALSRAIQAGTAPLILDVRTHEEFIAGHIPGAINVSYTEIASRLNELPSGKAAPVVVHCEMGRRAAAAESVLAAAGYTSVLDLEGHMRGWVAGSYPIVADSSARTADSVSGSQ